MSTVADLITEVKQTVEGWPGSPVRMVSDYRSDLERLAAGATKYQLQVGVAGINRARSNQDRTQVDVFLRVLHRLVNAFSERTYTEQAMQTYLAFATDVEWWKSLVTVNEIVEAPTVSLERVGNVVTLEVALQVVLKP